MLDAVALAELVGEAIARATRPLVERIAELEGRAKALGELVAALPPLPELPDVDALVAREVARGVAEVLTPLVERVAAVEGGLQAHAATVAALPDAPALDATVARSVGEYLAPLVERVGRIEADRPNATAIDEAIARAVDPLELRVERIAECVAEEGKRVDVTSATINRDGVLVLVLSDGSTRDVGPVVGRDVDPAQVERTIAELFAKAPKPRDAFPLDAFDVVLDDDGRTLKLYFEAGDVSTVHDIRLHTPIYRGVHKAGELYTRGDMVTLGGSLWHCNAAETRAAPMDGESAWQLAVKRGRDGKDGKAPPPPVGPVKDSTHKAPAA